VATVGPPWCAKLQSNHQSQTLDSYENRKDPKITSVNLPPSWSYTLSLWHILFILKTDTASHHLLFYSLQEHLQGLLTVGFIGEGQWVNSEHGLLTRQPNCQPWRYGSVTSVGWVIVIDYWLLIMPHNGKLLVLNLLRGRKSAFSPAVATRCTDLHQIWLGRAARESACTWVRLHVSPLARGSACTCKFHTKFELLHFLAKSRPTGASP